MAYLLNVTGALNKYVACNIPQPAIDTGRALRVEYEDEFEVRRTATDWPLASTSVSTANDLIFLRSGSDVEIRSTGNSNWTVTTGVNLSQFHVFRIRTTFNGTIATRQLYVDGVLKGTTTALSNARMGAIAAFFGLANDATRSGEFKYFKRTDFVNSANNRLYDANASGGTGNILPETINGFNGTQQGTWPAGNSEWVFYSSGATAYADTLLAGSYTHSGSLLNSSVGYSSLLQAGAFTHSGSDLGSSVARSSTLLAGSYSHSGSALGSAVGYSSSLQSGSFSYSGSELQSVIANGAQNYTDTLLGGSFTHSGSVLQSTVARNSTLLAGSYSHSGSQLTASLAFYSTLNGGSYSHFGSMLQSTISGQVTVSIEGYTITFAADDVSGAFAADTVAATFINDYVSATWSN